MTLILCAAPGCEVRVPEPLPRKTAVFPVYCDEHPCTCWTPEELLSCGNLDQVRRIYQEARAKCRRHG